MKNRFIVTSYRFHVNDQYQMMITGYFRENQKGKNELGVFLGEKKLISRIEEQEFLSGSMRNSSGVPMTKQYYLWIALPESWKKSRELRIIQSGEEGERQIYRLSVSKIVKKIQQLPCAIDKMEIEQGCFWVRGWYVSATPVNMQFLDQNKRNLDMHVEKICRPDICKIFPESREEVIGFIATYKGVIPQKMFVQIFSHEKAGKLTCTIQPSKIEKSFSASVRVIQKARNYYQKNGMQAVVKRLWDKMTQRTEISYREWYRRNRPSNRNLNIQRNTEFSYSPLISICITMDRESQVDLQETRKSLKKQSYTKWEEVLVETNSSEKEEVHRGDWIAYVNAGDVLSPDALYECVKLINRYPRAELVYSDEDMIDFRGKEHSLPNFKPDYNRDMLYSMNYIGDFFLIKTELIQKVGKMNYALKSAQKYDYLLRCIEKTGEVFHVPRVLYSKRETLQINQDYHMKLEQRILQEHYNRIGLCATVMGTKFSRVYRSKYQFPYKPLVSVIIPNKDHIKDLDKCIRSLFEVNLYQNIECIVVENNSNQDSTFAYYREIVKEFPQIKVVYWDGIGFNYPAINMHGVAQSNGEYLLFLNNDTEIMNADCVEELLGYCMREDVGAVGARLHYEDGSIQHAGVVVGLGGVAAHAFVDAAEDDPGYQKRIVAAQDYSAVTAACMMVKRNVFELVKGFDTNYAVAFNDVDLCLKIREAGYLVVYNPYAELMHYESRSRGYEDTPEKIERFQSEIQRFHKRWAEILEKGDPYYNPNLTLDKTDFSLSVVSRVKD